MAYSESGVPIPVDGYFSPGGYVTKQYLFDAYPQLSDQAKSAGLWTWGQNSNGQLGTNTVVNRSSPVQTISGGANWKRVTFGNGQLAAIKTDGTLWLWGRNDYGQLGDNTTVRKSSPVQTISGGTNWTYIGSTAFANATSAIKSDGTLWNWGDNSVGQLGDNTITSKSSPVQTVSGGTDWKIVSNGYVHTAAIKTDGSLWLWGINRYGRLGNNVNSFSSRYSSPIQTVAGGTNWKFVAAGSYHSAAIKTDGTLWLWGSNSFGQIGNNQSGGGLNSVGAQFSPVQTISGGTNWKTVSIGAQTQSAAIKTDGTLWLWGRNFIGCIGDNTLVDKSSPVQTIAGGTNWKLVSCGAYSATTIKTDGTLWTWGQNNNGQLGDNTTVNKSSPVQTISGGTNWKLVTAGPYYVAAIKDFNEDF